MEMHGLCVKCDARRKMRNVKEIVTKDGRKAVQGICLAFGSKMFKFLGLVAEQAEGSLTSDDYRQHLDLLHQARLAYHSRNYEEAFSHLRKAVEIEPNSVEAQAYMADCYFAMNQNELALIHVVAVLQLAAKQAGDWELLRRMWSTVVGPNLRMGLRYGIDGPYFVIEPERSTPNCPECDAQMWVSQRLTIDGLGPPTEFRCKCGYRREATVEEAERDTKWVCFPEYVCRWQDAI